MSSELTLAYSPCPNDTFLFYHLIHKTISETIKFKEELHDVEELNSSAIIGKYDITKLSFAAFFNVLDKYILLNSGSALGKNCGPILIKKKGKNITNIKGKEILIPGFNTTANLLLSLYLKKEYTGVPVRYDKIIPKLENEEQFLGVIIHEERFTYESLGFEKIIDLGEWWEEETNLPIPLGGIAIRRNIPENISREVDFILNQSLDLAWKNPENTKNYILQHSQSISEEVVNKHINLYVNNFTKDLGDEGRAAILLLYKKAFEIGLAPEINNMKLFLLP